MERETILRVGYLDRIAGFIDKPFIKIITGLRRSGKSELLKMIRDEVLKKTDASHIIYINFEDADYDGLLSYKKLNDYIESKLTGDKTYYIFLDEIQEVDKWEKAVNSLRLRNTDIFITGSNSKIMSDELATLLGGRTLSFEIFTLSFAEFIEFRQRCGLSYLNPYGTVDGKGYGDPGAAWDAELDAYIRTGGFPALSVNKYGESEARKIVQDINNTALVRDVIQRYAIRRPQLLDKIVSFVYDNVGNILSIASVSKYLKSQGRSSDPETIANYVKYLEDACIIKCAQRYDIKGKKLLETLNKYYLGDHSLQYAIRNIRHDKVQGILENIVYMELLRRGYTVYAGKMDGDKEIDFVVEKNGSGKVYIQVCLEFSNKETYNREFAPLASIKDNYPKYVVTMDRFWQADENGVRGIHLKDFLLKHEL